MLQRIKTNSVQSTTVGWGSLTWTQSEQTTTKMYTLTNS